MMTRGPLFLFIAKLTLLFASALLCVSLFGSCPAVAEETKEKKDKSDSAIEKLIKGKTEFEGTEE